MFPSGAFIYGARPVPGSELTSGLCIVIDSPVPNRLQCRSRKGLCCHCEKGTNTTQTIPDLERPPRILGPRVHQLGCAYATASSYFGLAIAFSSLTAVHFKPRSSPSLGRQ